MRLRSKQMDFGKTDTEAEIVPQAPFTLEGKTALVTGTGYW